MPKQNEPAGYNRSKMPFELYARFQEQCPQNFGAGETDRTWLQRCVNRSDMTKGTFYSASLRDELRAAVATHLAVVAGATPAGNHPRNPAPVQFAPTQDDARSAMTLLLEQHQASLSAPANGTIFWNGCNDLALARLAAEWSETRQAYVTLEGGTSVAYVNKRFVWGAALKEFFEKASAQLGLAASGHVTAICRFGLRDNSILTLVELPRMINRMQSQLVKGLMPSLTDITIVVINPVDSPETFAVYTNADMEKLMTWSPIAGKDYASAPSDCVMNMPLGKWWLTRNLARDDNRKPWVRPGTITKSVFPPELKLYWQRRHPAPHPLVTKITCDAAIARLFDFRDTK